MGFVGLAHCRIAAFGASALDANPSIVTPLLAVAAIALIIDVVLFVAD
jgi:hypothetical protein